MRSNSYLGKILKEIEIVYKVANFDSYVVAPPLYGIWIGAKYKASKWKNLLPLPFNVF